jgi:uncharacterized protein (DUF1778 family)
LGEEIVSMSGKSRPKAALKESKVQLRLRPGQKDLIARAAQVKQTTVTNFMVEHAYAAAQEVLADQVHFSLSPERWIAFCAALDAPPKAIPALRKLLKKPSVFEDDAAAP